jgi:hypothetical protein
LTATLRDLWVLRVLGLQRFDGHLADIGAHLLFGDVDATHAAFAEQLRDAIAAPDDLSDQ